MKILTSAQLKWLALITMTIDHIGYFLFPDMVFLRIIGRLSFPLYAFMVGQSYFHTHNRKNYFLTLLGLGILFQVVVNFIMPQNYINIFITLACGFLGIYGLDEKKYYWSILACLLGHYLPMDYGLYGVLMIVAMYYFKDKIWLLFTSLMILNYGAMTWWHLNIIQTFSIFSLIFILLYNGKKGKNIHKAFFYLYYPVHMIILYYLSKL